MIIYQVFCFIVVISVVVVVHEFGHYIVARGCGVGVDMFSLGFGKKIFSKKDKHGTEWKLCLLPFGGYVQMRGDENPASLNAEDEAKLDKKDKTAFYNKNLKQKFAIIFAGPLFNYILAIFIYASVAFFSGIAVVPNIIGSVAKDGPAYTAGLKAGDRIVEVNGKNINNFMEVKTEIMLVTKDSINLKIIRNNKIQSIPLKVEIKESNDGKKTKTKFVGIAALDPKIEKQALGDAINYAISESYRISSTSLRAIWQIISGVRSPRELGGPVKIALHSVDAASTGIIGLILFTAFISVNLGLMNLLPIPLLDGGHLFFYMIEGLIGRKLPKIVYKILLYAGMIVLGGLMAFTLVNDIMGIIRA